MRVEVTHTIHEDRMTFGDTISIFDNDEREIAIKRAQIYDLIDLLKRVEFRGKGTLLLGN